MKLINNVPILCDAVYVFFRICSYKLPFALFREHFLNKNGKSPVRSPFYNCFSISLNAILGLYIIFAFKKVRQITYDGNNDIGH